MRTLKVTDTANGSSLLAPTEKTSITVPVLTTRSQKEGKHVKVLHVMDGSENASPKTPPP